jgi:hypothetical protein
MCVVLLSDVYVYVNESNVRVSTHTYIFILSLLTGDVLNTADEGAPDVPKDPLKASLSAQAFEQLKKQEEEGVGADTDDTVIIEHDVTLDLDATVVEEAVETDKPSASAAAAAAAVVVGDGDGMSTPVKQQSPSSADAVSTEHADVKSPPRLMSTPSVDDTLDESYNAVAVQAHTINVDDTVDMLTESQLDLIAVAGDKQPKVHTHTHTHPRAHQW